MRNNLLAIVKSVLNDMDSDAVNSIADTEESMQVVSVAKDLFYAMVDEYELPYNHRVIVLDDAGVGKPNYLKLPDEVKKLKWLKYDCSIDIVDGIRYNDLTYLEPNEFLYITTKRNSTDTNTEIVLDPVTNIPIIVVNDKHPTYWTSFDDKYVCFDSYNKAIDAELQVSKTMASVEQAPEWLNTDSFDIPLPDHLQSLYLSELKSMCFSTLKQEGNAKIEQQATRLRFNVQGQKDRTNPKDTRPNYGRR